MRSLLVQASSVEKAVEKAWTDAGMPTEFNIKILDFGQKGFLGITKKPAIISITFEPKKQTAISRAITTKSVKPKPKPKQSPQKKEQTHPAYIPKSERPKGEHPVVRTFWTDSLIYDITSWLTEMTKTMKLTYSFKVQTQKKILTITFDKEVLATTEDERLLFSGLSYLLIQFLKKKHKKKYQGYKIMLTSKRT
jgi:spoIIIJ-associated protein